MECNPEIAIGVGFEASRTAERLSCSSFVDGSVLARKMTPIFRTRNM